MTSSINEEIRRLYLRTGEQVVHLRFPEWGFGVVTEERNSAIAGGMSYVKIMFRDGRTRIFDNNFANACCCYYAGVRRCEELE
ncbi:MAG: DUF3553 domain-containing protein [Deltaproteobacteria bacterium]|nr:DUF3553 domain-containing protein [Deltaproteobacteria bacterium]